MGGCGAAKAMRGAGLGLTGGCLAAAAPGQQKKSQKQGKKTPKKRQKKVGHLVGHSVGHSKCEKKRLYKYPLMTKKAT